MDPVRLTFWNIPKWAEIFQYIGGGLACLVFAWGLYLHIKKWRQGRSETLQLMLGQRLGALLQYALFQRRLSVDLAALGMHLAIFWGMVVLALATVIATIDWDVTHLLMDFQFLKGDTYLFFELGADIFGLLLIVGLCIAAYRRYVRRPERLATKVAPTFELDSFYLIAMLFGIAVTGYIIEATRLAVQDSAWNAWSPGGNALSAVFQPLSEPTLRTLHLVFWLAHAVLSFVFIASIPFSKAFHMVGSALSIFLRKLESPGVLNASDELGVSKITDFTWKQLAQLDGCTWCGRCQESCPAHGSGLELSPKNVVLKLGSEMLRPAAYNRGAPANKPALETLQDITVTRSELWACTTCAACETVCPVFIEQPRAIVDLRRHLVNQGDIEKGRQDALTKLTRYGNSFGQSERLRGRWTQELGFKVKDARKEQVEFLWFVGDYASYDSRAQVASRTVANILSKAGVEFGILYEGERNTGNDVRRIGEEGLFEMLRDKNMQAVQKARFDAIVTTDPHTYNALKNEYKDGLDGRPVLHYTELIDRLIAEGKLTLKNGLPGRLTYHDPCYLGRYNGVYDAPRRILKALSAELAEMPRNRDRSYCCGAGGGCIWMEEMPGIKERPADSRIREATALEGVETFVVACPKDIVMFQEAVKATGNEGNIVVKDIAELVRGALEQ